MSGRSSALAGAVVLLMLSATPVAARNINAENRYSVHKLVSDQPGVAPVTDPDLVNAWGITASATSPWWVADNATGKSTLYTGAGTKLGLTVGVPGAPTGTVFNGTTSFVVTSSTATGTATGPSRFIFDSEDGTLSGWNGVGNAVVAQTVAGAIYKGLAIGTSGGATYLYAADFHDGRVDVFDGAWARQTWTGAFVDPRLPSGYAPFGIQNLNGEIFVTYAKQDADAEDEIAGEGLGFVDAYGTDGRFHGRVATRGALNAPWGLAWAPSTFGKFANRLLVGNFGDGRIHAFARTPDGWSARGPVKGTNHRPLAIDGLWGIGFGNGANSGPTSTLYFAAGPDDESHGLFGSITAP